MCVYYWRPCQNAQRFADYTPAGIPSVAVYSEADRHSKHVSLADEAYCIGPAPARESYLLSDRILAAARDSGATAVHPGYGFLSENTDFAAALEAEGLTFVGPPAAAIRAMGDKSQAKALMSAAGVPVVPGYLGEKQDPESLLAEADRIGYPVLIKAVLGGGGKGMKLADSRDQFLVGGCKGGWGGGDRNLQANSHSQSCPSDQPPPP